MAITRNVRACADTGHFTGALWSARPGNGREERREDKTRIVDLDDEVDFLGFNVRQE